jgi:ribosome-associated translation inhibitor RaiA
MKISFSNLQDESRRDFDEIANRHISKLEKLLKRYVPDLVQLHGSFEKHPRNTQYDFYLNLVLPTGTLHATGTGKDVHQSAKSAFVELESQVKKHQALLRKDYEWKRKRERQLKPAPSA